MSGQGANAALRVWPDLAASSNPPPRCYPRIRLRTAPKSRTAGKNNGNGHHNNGASALSDSLLREIEEMKEVFGTRLYRGLLKAVAKVWNPKDIRDQAMQKKLLTHMQAAQRGLRRVDTAVEQSCANSSGHDSSVYEPAFGSSGG